MDLRPIVERELRLLSRRRSIYRARWLTALFATLIGFGVALASISAGSTTGEFGRNLFMAVALLAFVATIVAGPVLTADSLSEEKRNGTLGLLFLAGLKGSEVVAGKLAALSMPAVHCLLALFPILGFSFFMGGVTGGEFARVILVLSVTLVFSLSSAMAVSALSREGTRALGGSVILILFVAAALPAPVVFWPSPRVLPNFLASFSPLMGLWCAEAGNYASHTARGFWAFLSLNALASGAFFAVASFCIRRAWTDKPARGQKGVAWRPGFQRRRVNWRSTVRRQLLLEGDPLVWLTTRKRASSFAVWCLVLAAAIFSLFVCSAPGALWFDGTGIFVTFYSLHAILKVLIAWDASRRFAEDRESGALELLLCCPVEERGLWRSWLAGLKRTYLPPMLVLAAMELALLIGGMGWDGWWKDEGPWGAAFASGFGLLLADAYALSWTGMWQGISARNATRACLRTICFVLAGPVLVVFGALGFMAMLGATASFPIGGLLLTWFVLGYVADCAACGYSMLKLSDQFRGAVARATGAHEQRVHRRLARRVQRDLERWRAATIPTA